MATTENRSENEERKDTFPEKKSSESDETTPIIKEKIVYKVVHVPYYYPVPVDAEFYYQNQDRFLRHRDRYDERIFDHLPPPPYPYSHNRRSRDHYHKEMFASDFNRSRSPSPNTESRYLRARSRSSSPALAKKISEPSKAIEDETKSEEKIKREREESPEGAKFSSHSTESNVEEKSALNSQDFDLNEKQVVDAADNSDKQSSTSNETNNLESPGDEKHRNRRKRYLMTFPYDQKNKEGGESGSKKEFFNSGFKKFRSEAVHVSSDYPLDLEDRRYNDIPHKRSSHYYMSHPPSPPRTPYVMVPMRPIGVPSPDYIHERRFKSEHSQYRPQKRRDSDTEKETNESGSSKSQVEDFDQDSKDVRYHSNGRRVRTVFSRQQLLTLNNVFQKHPFVSGERMSELSKQLGLDRKIVKIWFQNKRQNARKKGSLFERADEYYCEQGNPRKKSFDRSEEYYYDYPQDRYSNRSSPPTMAENW